MIKNSVLTFILRLRAKMMCAHFGIKCAKWSETYMLINSIGHFDHFDIWTRNYARYTRAARALNH